MKKVKTFTIALLLFQAAIFGQEITVRMIDSLIGKYSVEEIIKGNYEKAEKQIRQIEYNDSGLFYLALGELELRRGNRDKALMNFIVASEESEKVAPFAFRRMGDMELKNGSIAYAVSAFRIAAQRTDFESYRSFLFAKIDSLKNTLSDSSHTLIWMTLFWDEEQDGAFEESPRRVLQRRLREEILSEDLYRELSEFARNHKIERNFLTLLADTTIVDTAFSAKMAFEVANEMFDKRQFNAASNWLHLAMNKSDFNQVIPRRRFLEFRTQLNFSLGNWNNVIRFGEEFIRSFGDAPDVLFNVGRAYRRIGNLAQAHKLYERYIRKYPNTRTAHDLLWYLAWVREGDKDFDSAKVLFSGLSRKRPVGRHGEEAGFRVGLIDFRRKRYDSALREFETFRRRFPNSRFASASLYWTARSHLAKDDTVQTRRFVDSLMVRFPLTYYDFRGRQIFGDTVASVLSVSDSVWHSRIDSIPRAETKGRNLSGSGDLDNLLLGIFLGTMGLKEEAELLFEPLQSQNQRNFPLVLSLSRFYNKIGLHYNSYRLARRLYWALPSNQRGEFSPEYLNLFYPTAYAREVKASAERHDVDPHLVWAVMRQESMFSPTILSPVGAVGLMQIMPNTGKEIARDLRISSFEASHLLDPELNVDFGVYYLGKRFGQTQDYVQTLAAYNGGLHNVRRWVRSNQDIIDDEPLFVEYIGFSETRNYVKLVLENYWMYKLIQP